MNIQLKKLKQLLFSVTAAMVILAISLMLLRLNVQARFYGSGAGGCGTFIDAVAGAEDGGIIAQMASPKDSGGAIITRNLTVQGGWLPPESGCNEANEVFTDVTDLLSAGFTYTPSNRSELSRNAAGEPVLRVMTHTGVVTLQNLILNNQRASIAKGGGLYGVITGGAQLTLENLSFHNNLTSGDSSGGGMYVEVRGGSRLVITGSEFTNNTANNGGGFEIRVYDGSHVIIHSSSFTSNSATTSGGVGRIIVESGYVTIAGSTFRNNSAGSGNGGALVIETTGSGEAHIEINDSGFSNNHADSGSGGAIFVEGTGRSTAIVKIRNVTYSGNSAQSDDNISITGNVQIFDKVVFLPVVVKNYPLPARITHITFASDNETYQVYFETVGFTPVMPGQHVHFFFDTVQPEYAGLNQNGVCGSSDPTQCKWYAYGGSNPFAAWKTSNNTDSAGKLCILVANSDHSVQLNTGNCYPLPTPTAR